MPSGSKADLFRYLADVRGFLLRTADTEEARFVFALQAGPIVISQHPTQARGLLQLAESVYGAELGEAFELSRLVARREDLEEESVTAIVAWQPSEKVYAALNPEKWVRFDEWVADQHLMEEAMMLDGPLDKESAT